MKFIFTAIVITLTSSQVSAQQYYDPCAYSSCWPQWMQQQQQMQELEQFMEEQEFIQSQSPNMYAPGVPRFNFGDGD